MTNIRRSARGKRPAFFEDASVDRVVSMLLELMSEVWVLKERLHVLEKVADDEGLQLSEKIEAYRSSEGEEAELSKARQEFIQTILRALSDNFENRAVFQQMIDEMNDTSQVPEILKSK